MLIGKDPYRPVNIRFRNSTDIPSDADNQWQFVLIRRSLKTPSEKHSIAFMYTTQKPLGADQWTLLARTGTMMQEEELILSVSKIGSPPDLTDFTVTFSIEGREVPNGT